MLTMECCAALGSHPHQPSGAVPCYPLSAACAPSYVRIVGTRYSYPLGSHCVRCGLESHCCLPR